MVAGVDLLLNLISPDHHTTRVKVNKWTNLVPRSKSLWITLQMPVQSLKDAQMALLKYS